jgi:hypothetical protein
VLPSLLPELAGKVNLIYIDPPFATGADFSFIATIPEADESFTKEPSMIEQKAYRDTWGRGLDSYLQWFYEAVMLLRELLAEDGSFYVHCDWRVTSAVRLVMDEIFGEDYFRDELIWRRGNINTNTASNQFPRHTAVPCADRAHLRRAYEAPPIQAIGAPTGPVDGIGIRARDQLAAGHRGRVARGCMRAVLLVYRGAAVRPRAVAERFIQWRSPGRVPSSAAAAA